MNEDEIKQIAALVVTELKKMNAVQSDSFAGRILFSPGEMARRCGVTPKTWYAWVKRGDAPAPVIVGGNQKWLKTDIKNWENELREKAINKMFEGW